MDPFLKPLAVLLLASQSGDSERNYPNVAAPLYSFGVRGSGPGQLAQASALAVGKDDLLYIADAGNHRVQMVAMNGQPRGAFGTWGRGPSQFAFPSAIAVAADGTVFVADAAGRLQAFNPEGRFLQAWEGLRSPRGIAATADRVYVSEADLHRIRVYPRSGGSDAYFGGPGTQPGRFLFPSGLAVDEDGSVYVADSGNHRIQKLDAAGAPLAQWGAWGGQAGLLSHPAGIACVEGRIHVADHANHRIQVFDRAGVLLKQWGAAPSFIGEAKGRLHFPEGLAVSPSGGLTVVSEPLENRIQVFANRSLTKTARVNDLPWWDSLHARMHSVRLAPPPPGSRPQAAAVLAVPDVHAVFCFDVSSDALGPIAAAGGFGPKLGELNGIGGVVVDPVRSRLVIGDPGNNRLVTFELPRNPARPELFGNTIRVVGSTAFDRLAAPPPPGYSPDLAVPGPMARAEDGRILILDRANAALLVCDADLRFRKRLQVSPTLQEFAVSPTGVVYGTDPASGRIRVYDAEGREQAAWSGEFRLPWGIAIDGQGFVYVSDALEDAVLKYDGTGRFVKRWGMPGTAPDRFSSPRGLTFHRPDRLIIQDHGNHRAQLCSTEGEFLGNYVAGGLATPITIR